MLFFLGKLTQCSIAASLGATGGGEGGELSTEEMRKLLERNEVVANAGGALKAPPGESVNV